MESVCKKVRSTLILDIGQISASQNSILLVVLLVIVFKDESINYQITITKRASSTRDTLIKRDC